MFNFLLLKPWQADFTQMEDTLGINVLTKTKEVIEASFSDLYSRKPCCDFYYIFKNYIKNPFTNYCQLPSKI